jgi:carbamoyl-phosphate synthase large subunit
MVTGVGGGVGQSIIKGLRLAERQSADIDYRLVGTDADSMAAGLYRADVGYRVPYANEPEYIDRLVEIATTEDVDLLIPGHDAELRPLAEAKGTLEDEGEMHVLVSATESVEIGLDKWQTHQFLSDHGFLTPRTALATEADRLVEEVGFPLVVKPRTGSASQGLHVITDTDELKTALERSSDPIVQEYLVPDDWEDDPSKADLKRQIDEYSVEIIVDSAGDIVSSLANWRKMVDGVPSVARIEPYDEVRSAAEAVIDELDILGPANLQARVTDQGVTFFELNTRFTGSTAVRCAAGFNGPHTIVRNVVLGEPLTADDLQFEELVELRYKDEIYVTPADFDRMVREGRVENGGWGYDYF